MFQIFSVPLSHRRSGTSSLRPGLLRQFITNIYKVVSKVGAIPLLGALSTDWTMESKGEGELWNTENYLENVTMNIYISQRGLLSASPQHMNSNARTNKNVEF